MCRLCQLVLQYLDLYQYLFQPQEQPEGHQCLCRAAGKLTKFRIKLLAGDKVLVEISPYDLSRGRITYRERNAGGARPTTNKNNPKRNNK